MFTLHRNRSWLTLVLTGIILVSGVIWAFYPSLTEMERRWAEDAHYSHGYLVPFFCLALLWLRRDCLVGRKLRPSWWGVLPLLAAAGLRMAGGSLFLDWFNQIALLPTAAGVCLLCGGWAALRWAWPSIVFLFFMIPLPFRMQVALGGPLQHLATLCSTYLLQTLGYPAIAEGNIIQIDQFRIGVVEACNGLGMLLSFFALSTALILVTRWPVVEQLAVLASTVPIAVAANVARITVTAVLSELASNETASLFFHDLAGWFMMPLALGLLLAGLGLLRWLFVETAATTPLPVAIGTSTRAVVPNTRSGKGCLVSDASQKRGGRLHASAKRR